MEDIVEADFLLESNRLATFDNWPNPNISPQALAKAGFYYLNRFDQVKCAWCRGVMAKWEKQDNAFEEHKRFFPNCPRVQLGPHIEIANDTISDLGIYKISPPKKPKYSSLDSRLRTYTSWPIPDIQRPESLAEAGLFYQNIDDQVRCFHCNMGLRSWQREDDPWFEHAKWFPHCQFVRLVKGAKYVEQVLAHQSACQPSVMTVDEAMIAPAFVQTSEMGIDGGIKNRTEQAFGIDTANHGVRSRHSETGEVSTLIRMLDVAGVNETFGSSIVHPSVPYDEAVSEPISVNIANIPPSSVPAIATLSANTSQRNISFNCTETDPFTAESRENISIPSTVEQTNDTCESAVCNRSLSLEEENRKLKDARLCKVCLDDEVGVVFLPCGHLVTCVQCAPGVNQCPMCRTAIKGFVRTYLS